MSTAFYNCHEVGPNRTDIIYTGASWVRKVGGGGGQKLAIFRQIYKEFSDRLNCWGQEGNIVGKIVPRRQHFPTG